MAKKNLLLGILALVLVLGVGVVSAEEKVTCGFQPVSLSTSGMFNINLMASGNNSGDYTEAERAGIIGLNFLFGTGSFMTGHISHGVILALLQAGGITLLILPSVMGLEAGLSEQGKENIGNSSDNDSNDYYNENLTPETNGMVWLYVGGAALLIADIVFSIIWPLDYTRASSSNQTRNASLGNMQNWNIGIVPTEKGNVGLGVSFKAHF